MFEDAKWSASLKKEAIEFLTQRHLDKNALTVEAVVHLILTAIEEGRIEVQENPHRFELLSEDDCRELEREPQRDESRD